MNKNATHPLPTPLSIMAIVTLGAVAAERGRMRFGDKTALAELRARGLITPETGRFCQIDLTASGRAVLARLDGAG